MSAPLKHYGTPAVAVSFGKLSCRSALDVQRLLAKAASSIGPAIAKASKDEMALQFIMLGALSTLPKDEFWELVEALAGTLTYGGKQLNLDAYQGSQLDLDKMLIEALRVNFPDFFALFAANLPAAGPSTGNGSETPTTNPSP
jgi:hypothetical protein